MSRLASDLKSMSDEDKGDGDNMVAMGVVVEAAVVEDDTDKDGTLSRTGDYDTATVGDATT